MPAIATKALARARASVRIAARMRSRRGSRTRSEAITRALVPGGSRGQGQGSLGASEGRRWEEVGEGGVKRTQVGIELLRKITGEKTEPLPGLDRRAREEEPAHLAIAQRRDAHRDGEVRLAGAGRTGR